MSTIPEECARELLEVAPLVMRDMRAQMRSRRTPELTVPQFRTLLYVNQNKDSSLSEVACHMGLTLPSTSRLVDDLIKHSLMTREEHPADRRKVKLAVTPRGFSILEISRKGTLKYLAEKLRKISTEDRISIIKAMKAIREVLQE